MTENESKGVASLLERFRSINPFRKRESEEAKSTPQGVKQAAATRATSTSSPLAGHPEAFQSYISGEISRYYQIVEEQLSNGAKERAPISYASAAHDFFDLLRHYHAENPTFDKDGHLRKYHTILKRYYADTAFELYIRHLLSKSDNPKVLKKHLNAILEKDAGWVAAYVCLGDIAADRSDWSEAEELYRKALQASQTLEAAYPYARLGWVSSKLRKYENAEAAYRKCLELTPGDPEISFYLADCLSRQKKYEAAIECFNALIAQDAAARDVFRGKYDALKKLGHADEAQALAAEHPEHFNTKRYRADTGKLSEETENMNDRLDRLNGTTESDFAGEMRVAEDKSGIELYQHQKEAIRAMDRVILNADDYAGLLVLPTGGGKTLTATYWLMASLLDKGRKIVWLAHRHELLNQAQHSFERVCYRDISRTKPAYNWRIISGQHDKPIHIKPTDDIIIASKTSLKRGLNYFLKNWLEANGDKVFLIIDEAHHATASEYRELIENIRSHSKRFKMLGLTATPFRTNEDEQGLLKKIFPDDIVYKIDLRELINRGILSEPIFKSVPTDVNMLQLFEDSNSQEQLDRIARDSFFDIESIGRETAAAIANNRKRNNAIVSEYVKHRGMYRQTLVFALNVQMAIVLSGLFRDAGVRADFVVSEVRDLATGVTISDEENALKLQQFRSGELDVLVNVNILTEGTDLPKVQSVFLARPTKSTILMTQMIGRALRGEKAGGTKDAYIVSFIDDWQDKIAWVNPERLFIDENVDFSEQNRETSKMAMRLVSISKLEEFARIANGTIDETLSDLPFIDRIPMGIYKFSYLLDGDGEDEVEKSCDVLVYDCMKEAYQALIGWLPTADLTNEEAAAEHVDATLFRKSDVLLGYDRQDVLDLIRYYKATRETPPMISLSDRKHYDVDTLARHIIENDMTPSARKEYIDAEWSRSDGQWSAFFGVENQKAFRKLINDAVDRIENPADYGKPKEKPITTKELVQVQSLPLIEIRRRFPALEEELREAVFRKHTDSEGYYFSAKGSYRSKSRLDFQIDHIVPLAHGGLTVPDNLQLLTRAENLQKSDH